MWQCINRLSHSRVFRIQVIYLSEAHTCIPCLQAHLAFSNKENGSLQFFLQNWTKATTMHNNARPRSSKTWSAGLLCQQNTAGNMPETVKGYRTESYFDQSSWEVFSSSTPKHLWRTAGNSKSPDFGSWTTVSSICDCPYHRDNSLYSHRGKQKYAKEGPATVNV